MRRHSASSDPFSRRKRPTSAEMDFTSLIDVVFLLLIFFMVTSTMTGQSDVEVPPAKHGKGMDPSLATILILREPLQPGGETRLIIGDDPNGQPASIEDARAAIEQKMADGINQVLIKAERKVPHQDVLEVARIVGSFESGELYIGVQQLP